MPTVPILLLIHPSDRVSPAEKQLKTALDDLVATGVLQKSNQMDIEALLNPANKTQNTYESSDADIFAAVQDATAALQSAGHQQKCQMAV